MTTRETLHKIAFRMLTEVLENRQNYEPDNRDWESLFERCFEAVVGTNYTETAYEEAFNSGEVQEMIDEIENEVREYWADRQAYQNPMQYYGLKQSDFI